MKRRPAKPGTVFAWALYELGATSVAMNVLSFYLPLDIASRVPRGSEKFSVAFAISMLIVALGAPFLGTLADEKGKRRFLVPFVLTGVACTALLALPGPIGRVLFFFALANIAFQSAYVFYNALLPDVTDESTQGRVSGYGVAAGYLGALLGMVLVLLFVSAAAREKVPAFAKTLLSALSIAPVSGSAFSYVNAYVPTALVWLCAASPLLFFANLPRIRRAPSGVSPLSEVWRTLRSLPRTPPILWFLVSNFLYIDVIHTIQIQMSTYSRYAIGLNDRAIFVLLIVCTAVAILGGLGYGFLCQVVSIRTATLVALGNWVLVFVLALVIRDPKAFYAVGLLAGIGLGGIKVTSKLGLVDLVPKERMAEFFGFFTLAGEAASVLGPFLWAATLSRFPDKSPSGYRAALGTLFVVLVLAIGTFLKVKFGRPPDDEAAAEVAEAA